MQRHFSRETEAMISFVSLPIKEKRKLLFTGRHFWNRKCRKKTWWQQEFAVLKCEAKANSITGHICVNSNKRKASALQIEML